MSVVEVLLFIVKNKSKVSTSLTPRYANSLSNGYNVSTMYDVLNYYNVPFISTLTFFVDFLNTCTIL